MKRIIKHLLLPAMVPVIFFAIASIPVEIIGCRNRGLIVFSIAFLGVLVGLGSAILALVRRMRGDSSSGWFVLTTIILALPAVFLVLVAM